MKLLLDMNLSPRWRGVLETRGHEAVHWVDVGLPTAADVTIMRYAASHGFVVVTHDLDFGAILAATGGASPSVVQLRGADISPEAAQEALLAAINACEADLRAGALLTIDVTRFRVSLLPLRRRDA